MSTTTNTQVKDHPETRINIVINQDHFQVHETTLTGEQLATLGGVPAGNQLFLDVPGNGDDKPIGAQESVTLHSGMRFYDVPVGNLG